MKMTKKFLGEFLGSAFLLTAVVGSGIMGNRLSGGNDGLALLANSIATGGALTVLILMFGPLSGAHFNPVVTLSSAALGSTRWSDVPAYLIAQILGALVGVLAANAMFGETVFVFSHHARDDAGQLLGEFIATFGLVLMIHLIAKSRPTLVAFAVGAYIMAAYWFTSSMSFANPAVTLARALTDTFTGIRPQDVPGFIASQCLGATAATLIFRIGGF